MKRFSPKSLFPLLVLVLLSACQGAGMSNLDDVAKTENAPPPAKVASNDGVLSSQSASQDVTKNYAVNLRFPGEPLKSNSDINILVYRSTAEYFPFAQLEKVIAYPEFKHEACCEGRVLRVVDLGALPLADGNTEVDRIYHTFTKLLTGDLEIQDIGQVRYRDYVIGSPDEMGQNVKWDDLPMKADDFYSFFLMPEGQTPQGNWQSFPSKELLFQMYVDKQLVKVRDLRVLPGIKILKVSGVTEINLDDDNEGS